MMKQYLKLFIIILVTNSIAAQISDKEIYDLIVGDWYCIGSPDTNCFVNPDSAYIECSFLERYFDFYKYCEVQGGITPYRIQNGHLIVSEDTSQKESGFVAEIILIDSNRIILKSSEGRYLLNRLVSDDYSLSDYMQDQLVFWECLYKLNVPEDMFPMLGAEIDSYYHQCFIRRQILTRLNREETDKQSAIKNIERLYLDSGKLPYFQEQEFRRFILMINDFY